MNRERRLKMADRPEFTISQLQMIEAIEYYYNNVVYRPERRITVLEVKQRNSYNDDFSVFIVEPTTASKETEVISSGD